MKYLSECKAMEIGEIIGLSENAPLKIRRRLCDLGFTPGQKVKLVRKSVLGKALLIEIRGYTLSVRSTVAEVVVVK